MIYTTNFEKAGDFMEAIGQDVQLEPTWPGEWIRDVKLEDIATEADEIREAIECKNILGVARALTDMLYVVYEAGHEFGIDLDDCYNEIHRSKMSRLGKDGRPIRNSVGELISSPDYELPNLEQFLT
jgi:predicted HAD superfamily Cof-like phosphohydrolase